MDPEKPSPIEEHKFLNMAVDHESLLSEFPQQVVDSHALVVAEILAGERPSIEILLQLGAEALTVDKLTVLAARQVSSISAAHDCWQDLYLVFSPAWIFGIGYPLSRRPAGRTPAFARTPYPQRPGKAGILLATDHDRAVFNAQRDHGMPLPLA